jgi:anti-sigma factor RsiW
MIERRSGEIDGFGTDHPEVDELIGYVRGELSQRRAASVRMHAAECMDCGDQLAALILLREERLYTGGAAPPQAKVTRFPVPAKVPVRRRWAASAAAALLIPALVCFGWSARVVEH